MTKQLCEHGWNYKRCGVCKSNQAKDLTVPEDSTLIKTSELERLKGELATAKRICCRLTAGPCRHQHQKENGDDK